MCKIKGKITKAHLGMVAVMFSPCSQAESVLFLKSKTTKGKIMEQQNQSTEVAVVKINLAPEAVFTSLVNGDGFSKFKKEVLEKFIAEKKSIVFGDEILKTAAGRKQVISVAASVTAAKAPFEEMVLNQVRIFEEKPAQVRANLKEVLKALTDASAEIRRPVTEIEAKLKEEKRLNDERIAAIKAVIAQIEKTVMDNINQPSTVIRSTIVGLSNWALDYDFMEFKADADSARANTLAKLEQMAVETEQREAQAAETARQLAELEAMKKAEAERVANEAKAQAEREAKERAEREAFEAKIKAEADAKQAVIDAENARLAQIERDRIAAEQAEIARQQAEIARQQKEIADAKAAQEAKEKAEREYLADWDLAILQYATWCENKAFEAKQAEEQAALELANSERVKAENDEFNSLNCLWAIEAKLAFGEMTIRGALIAAYHKGAAS